MAVFDSTNIENDPNIEDVDVRVDLAMSTHDVASVRLTIDVGDIRRTFTGSSKRDPRDPVDEELGMEIAFGRALSSAGHYLLRHSAGLVKHNDDVKADKLRRKEEAKKKKPKKK
jgi:hypothetical protein